MMQAHTSGLELHTRMTELAMDLLKSGHDFHAGALSSLALSLQKDIGLEIEARDVTNP